MPGHRRQRHDARAASDQQDRFGLVRIPDEVAADRASHLDLVALARLVHEVGRDLAFLEALDGEREAVAGRGGDRVAALGLVAVLGGEAHVEMLAGAVTGPAVDFELERPHPRSLLDRAGHRGGQPAQSPQYRCSSHGSPRMW